MCGERYAKSEFSDATLARRIRWVVIARKIWIFVGCVCVNRLAIDLQANIPPFHHHHQNSTGYVTLLLPDTPLVFRPQFVRKQN